VKNWALGLLIDDGKMVKQCFLFLGKGGLEKRQIWGIGIGVGCGLLMIDLFG
jgi:hypothetical protein